MSLLLKPDWWLTRPCLLEVLLREGVLCFGGGLIERLR